MALKTWVMVSSWSFLDRYEPAELLDHLEEANTRALAFGSPVPVAPDPAHYAQSPVKPLSPPDTIMAYAARADAFVAEAERRGFPIFAYGTCPHMNGRPEVYRQLPMKMRLGPDGARVPVESYWGACANGDA